jgi:hypothetical protein
VVAAGPAHLTPRGFTNVLGVVKIIIIITSTEFFAVLRSLFIVGVRREGCFFLRWNLKIRPTKRRCTFFLVKEQNNRNTRQQQVVQFNLEGPFPTIGKYAPLFDI